LDPREDAEWMVPMAERVTEKMALIQETGRDAKPEGSSRFAIR
jgi:hypothetical protein